MTDMDFTARGLLRKLDSDLGSHGAGKGASLIGLNDGSTVQGRLDRMKVGTLEEMATQPVSEGDAVELTDSSKPGTFAARPAAELNAVSVSADTQGGIYRPSNANSAYVWVRQMERIKPEFFGDVSDPDTAHIAMNNWAKMGSLDKYVMLVDREYQFKEGLSLPDNCIIEMASDGWLHNVRTAADGGNQQHQHALLLGRMHPVWLPFETGDDGATGAWTAAFDWYDLDDISSGAPVQFTTAADMDNFTDWQTVLVSSSSYSSSAAGSGTPGKNWNPHTLVATVLVKASSGQWRSLYPLPPITSPKVTNLVTATTDATWDGRSPHIARNVRIYGGKVSSDAGKVTHKTGFLGCDIHLAEADGSNAVSTNAGFFSKIAIDRSHTWSKAVEIACGSHALDVEIRGGTHHDDGAGDSPFRIGENPTDCRIRISNFHIHGRSGSAANHLLVTNAGRRNSITWESGRLTGNWLGLMVCNDIIKSDSADANATQAACSDNHMHIDERVDCKSATCTRVVYDFSSYDLASDSLNACRNNRYSGGPDIVASAGAVRLEGHRTRLGNSMPFKVSGSTVQLVAGNDGGHEINLEGSFTWISYDRSKIARLRLDGQEQVAGPLATSSPGDASVAYTVDMSARHHKVLLANAVTTAFEFTTYNNFHDGGRVRVEIHNTTGAAILPTANTTYFKLQPGLTWPSIGNNNVLMVELMGLRTPAPANRIVVTGIVLSS